MTSTVTLFKIPSKEERFPLSEMYHHLVVKIQVEWIAHREERFSP